MKYRGMFVEITPESGILREDLDGGTKVCPGYRYRVFSDTEMTDEFCAAVGFELPDDSTDETGCLRGVSQSAARTRRKQRNSLNARIVCKGVHRL